MYKQAQNGRKSAISFKEKSIYYLFDINDTANIDFKNPLSKEEYLKDMVKEGKMDNVLNLMENWELYENGWVVTNHNNSQLFNYLTQIFRTSRPKELDYFK
jgi:hypothetical protein